MTDISFTKIRARSLGSAGGKFIAGQKVRVMVERIDPVEKKIQFALLRKTKKTAKEK